MDNIDRRQGDRQPYNMRVEIFHPGIGTMVGRGKDISDSGVAAFFEQGPLPPIGTIVQVKFKRLTGPINEDPVAMKVARHDKHLVAFTFRL